MKQYWQRMALQIDALSLRERTIVFVMVALILGVLVNTLLLDPQYVKQKKWSQQINQDQAKIAQMQAEIEQKINAQTVDPDASNLVRLQQLNQQLLQMQDSLRLMQKGLVSPDKMSGLLEAILRRNGQLRLLSLRSLPVSNLNDPILATGLPPTMPSVALTKEKNELEPLAGAVYKHGVEITVQGNYLELMHYMSELEKMPWQLFWGKANLNVDEYPKATLVLTLFTLSLDKKWLNM